MQPSASHRRLRRPSVWIIAVVAVLGLATPIHAAAAPANDANRPQQTLSAHAHGDTSTRCHCCPISCSSRATSG